MPSGTGGISHKGEFAQGNPVPDNTVLLVTTRWQHAIIYLAMSVWVVVSSVPSTSLPKLNIGK